MSKVRYNHQTRKRTSKEGPELEAAVNSLQEWAKRMGYQSPPSPEELRALIKSDVDGMWDFVEQHIVTKREAEIIQGNVLLHTPNLLASGLYSECQLIEERCARMQGEFSSLQLAISQLDYDITRLQADLVSIGQDIHQTEEQCWEMNNKSALLGRGSSHGQEVVGVLGKYSHQLLRTAQELRHKASAAQPNTNPLQQVKEACSHVQHQLQQMTENPSDCSEAQQVSWSKLEALFDQLPCQQLLGAIVTLTEDATREVRNQAQLIDLQEDARRLRYRCDGEGTFVDDCEQFSALHTVEEHIQESQLNHIRCSLELERLRMQGAATEKQLANTCKEWEELSTKLHSHDPVSLQLLGQTFKLELEVSGLQGAVDCLTAIHQTLVQTSLEKQRIDSVLREKFSDIQAFMKKAEKGRELTQALIQHNSSAKHQLLSQRKEVDAYISKSIIGLNTELSPIITSLQGKMLIECNSLCAINLQRIIPSPLLGSTLSELSIYHSPDRQPYGLHLIWSGLLKALQLPPSSNPRAVLTRCVELLKEAHQTQEDFKKKEPAVLAIVQRLVEESRLKEILEASRRNVQNQQQQLLLSVTRQLSETSQTFARLPEAQRALSDWWGEPAQSVVPWVKLDGMNVEQWRERWVIAVGKYRQLQGDRQSN